MFESLRPDHIKSMKKPGSEATGFLCLQFTSLIALPTEVGCAGCSLRRGDAFRLHGQVLISLDLASLAPIMRTSFGADLSENLF